MNTIRNTTVENFPAADEHIPTLDTPHRVDDKNSIKLDTLVEQLAEELRASLHQHLYQAMVKTLHQVVNQESKQLHSKILEKLQQQLPEIIETACHKSDDKHSA